MEALSWAEDTFDLIFSDIDKQAYPDSLPVIEGKLRPRGVLIVDNALWHGRVFDRRDTSEATRVVVELTRALAVFHRGICGLPRRRQCHVIELTSSCRRYKGSGGPPDQRFPHPDSSHSLRQGRLYDRCTPRNDRSSSGWPLRATVRGAQRPADIFLANSSPATLISSLVISLTLVAKIHS